MRFASWALATGFLFASPVFAAAPCADLKNLQLDHTTVELAEAVPAGAFHPPYGPPLERLPDFCRVAGILTPSSDSVIRFEVWLPSGGWNDKIAGTGNGGFAGSIDYRQMSENLRAGFVSTGTNTGHEANGLDGSWAYRHPEKVIDFGHRAIHETAIAGKAVAAAFYGHAARYSYFASCSNGGREALMEVQRFPEDYDGVLAGAPANFWSHLAAGRAESVKRLLDDPVNYISATKLPAIARAVEKACGARDGVVEDPEHCHFDPQVLVCRGAESRDCLTAAQAGSLAALYAESHDRAGKPLFPGFVPGSEEGPGGWSSWILGEGPGSSAGYGFYANYLRYLVYSDPHLNPLTVDSDEAVKLADSRTAAALNAVDPDLRRFAAHGGKLLLYHGWNDPAISPLNSIAYFHSVQATVGQAAAEKFTRLYMLPGVQHCFGGPGASAAGQFGPAEHPNPQRLFDALEAWVEQGKAPAGLIATKFAGDNASAAVLFTRPLCAYPARPKYDGHGDPHAAASFTCAQE